MSKLALIFFLFNLPAGAEELSVRDDIAPFGLPDIETTSDINAELLSRPELAQCILRYNDAQRERAEVDLEYQSLALDEINDAMSKFQAGVPKATEPKSDLDRQLDEIESSLNNGSSLRTAKISSFLRHRLALESAIIDFGKRCARKKYSLVDLRALRSSAAK